MRESEAKVIKLGITAKKKNQASNYLYAKGN